MSEEITEEKAKDIVKKSEYYNIAVQHENPINLWDAICFVMEGYKAGAESMQGNTPEATYKALYNKQLKRNRDFLKGIEQLKADKQELVDALEFIYDECDWEECTDKESLFQYGDNRIGDVCKKLLTKHKENKDE